MSGDQTGGGGAEKPKRRGGVSLSGESDANSQAGEPKANPADGMSSGPEEKLSVASATRSPLPPPPPIPDHKLLRVIGKGAYGEVWLARSVFGAYRAVKVIHRSRFDSNRPYEREFAGIQRFEPISRSHPGFVHVLHAGRDDAAGYFFYVMELADDVAGAEELHPETYQPRTLRQELVARGQLPAREVIATTLNLASAMACLHREGLVHRDIKPANIIFVKGAAKLADIGLVCGTAGTQSFVGTEGYIPPEGPGSPAADIYSLGMVLYQMVTGKECQDYPAMPESLPGQADHSQLVELNAVVLQACAWNVKERYPTADAMRQDLRALQEGRSVRKHTTDRWWNIGSPRALVGLAVLLAVGLGIWLIPSITDGTKRSSSPLADEMCHLARRTEGAPGDTKSNSLRAITIYRDATNRFPNLALAYAGLARIYQNMDWDVEPHQGWGEQAFAVLPIALRLQPDLAEAYAVRGRLHYGPTGNWDTLKAVDDFMYAIGLDPALDTGHVGLGFAYFHCGFLPEAIAECDKAIALNRRSFDAFLHKAQALTLLLQFEEADRIFRNLYIGQGEVGAWLHGMCLHYRGLTNEATELVQKIAISVPDNRLIASVQAVFAASRGDRNLAHQKIKFAATEQPGLSFFHHIIYHIGAAYALLGEPREAMQYLRQSAEGGFPCYPYFRDDPNLKNLRTDPNYQAFLVEMEKTFNKTRANLEEIRKRVERRLRERRK